MKFFSLWSISITCAVLGFQATAQSDLSISIDKIQCGAQVVGSVSGLNASKNEQHKVLMFVYTNKWWIHPRYDGPEGLSHAKISSTGMWDISTIHYGHPTTQVAAVVVPISYELFRADIDFLSEISGSLALVARPAPPKCF